MYTVFVYSSFMVNSQLVVCSTFILACVLLMEQLVVT